MTDPYPMQPVLDNLAKAFARMPRLSVRVRWTIPRRTINPLTWCRRRTGVMKYWIYEAQVQARKDSRYDR